MSPWDPTRTGGWSTFGGAKLLVAAPRTVTSAVRPLETLPAPLRGDHRNTVVLAHDPAAAPAAAFGDGVPGVLRDA
ncbi:hypothetical protein ACSNOC_27925, partial [Streptomyces sp. URMC 129]